MREQQHRLLLSRSAKARNQVAVARFGDEDLDVGGGKAGIAKARGHRFRRGRHVAGGLGGVDLDELLVDVARQLPRRVIERRNGGGGAEWKREDDENEKFAHTAILTTNAARFERNRNDHEELHRVEHAVRDDSGNQILRPIERESDDQRDQGHADQK